MLEWGAIDFSVTSPHFKGRPRLLLGGEKLILIQKITTILFGHILDQDLRDTMDRINALDGVVIVAFDIKLNGEEKSTALINIEADVGLKQTVFNRIAEIAEEKDLLVINEV